MAATVTRPTPPVIPPLQVPEVPYLFVQNEEQIPLLHFAASTAKHFAVDTETTGLDPLMDKIRLIQVAIPGHPVFVIDLWAVSPEGRVVLQQVFSLPATKVFHNAKFDLKFLKRSGFNVSGQLFDTMLAAYMLEIGRNEAKLPSLKELAGNYLKVDLPKEHQLADYSGTITPEMLEYAARDAEVTRQVYPVIARRMQQLDLIEAAKLEFGCLPAVVEMELNGMLISLDRLSVLGQTLQQEKAEKITKARQEMGDFNHNSSVQVVRALKECNINVEKTDKHILKSLTVDHPEVQTILDLRKIDKAISTIVEKFPRIAHPVTGRLHPNYKQLGARTGRFSATNPNLQQVDRREPYRSVFIAPPGHQLVIADYSQIEPRILADISGDTAMIEALTGDIYRAMGGTLLRKDPQAVTGEERKKMKVILLGLIYGMGLETMVGNARDMGISDMTVEEAKTIKKQFFAHYKQAGSHIRACYASAEADTVTMSGRKRFFSEGSTPMQRVNSPIQGTAADIMKLALASLVEDLTPLRGKLIACVHDETVVEVPTANAEATAGVVKARMEAAARHYLTRAPVEVKVDIGPNWASKS